MANFSVNAAAITNAIGSDGNRFGDKLVYYLATEWVHYKHNAIPFFFTPFAGSEYFAFYNNYPKLTQNIKNKFNRILEVGPDSLLNKTSSILYKVISSKKYGNGFIFKFYKRLLKHPDYRKNIKEKMQLVKPLPLVHGLKERFCISVHIRKGGGYDPPLISNQIYQPYVNAIYHVMHVNNVNQKKDVNISYADKRWPSKFPPEQFYIDQIRYASELLGDIPIYVYIFTDDARPATLRKRIENQVNKSNIMFDSRADNHNYKQHFLTDFVNMTKFDGHISSRSHFGFLPALIADHALVIIPLDFKWIDNKLHVTDVQVVIDEERKQQVLTRMEE